MRPIIICKCCQREKPHKAKGMCKTCYKAPYMKRYLKQYKRKNICCSECNLIKPHHGKRMCKKCYSMSNACPKCQGRCSDKSRMCINCRRATESALQCTPVINRRFHPDPLRTPITCSRCKLLKIHQAKGMCSQCYNKKGRHHILCSNCGRFRPHYAKRKCRPCWNKHRRKELKQLGRQYTRPLIICKSCEKKKPHSANGVCKKCYKQWRSKAKQSA